MPPRAARPGRLPAVARYEFGDPLGSGGLGTVYRALDRYTGQVVAVKVLRASLTENPKQHQRLVQEFRAATQLEHPNIVRALDIGSDGTISYLVFELIDGTTKEYPGRKPKKGKPPVDTKVILSIVKDGKKDGFRVDVPKPADRERLAGGKFVHDYVFIFRARKVGVYELTVDIPSATPPQKQTKKVTVTPAALELFASHQCRLKS